MILIVGGAGYIGSHVNKELNRRGYKTVVYDSLVTGHAESVKWGIFEYGDIFDSARLDHIFEKYDIDAVFHFAAFAYVGESVTDPAKYYRNNVAGTINLLQAMMRHNVKKLVFSSTCATYGEPDAIPISESQAQKPVNPYGKSKLMVEDILCDFDRAYGLRYVSLRYFNAAGADTDCEIGESHDPETHIIPLIFDAASEKSNKIRVFGTDYDTRDGSCIRDYIHVCDLADAHIRAWEYINEYDKSDCFNLGTSTGTSVLELINGVERVTRRKIAVEYADRRPGDPAVLIGSNEKALALLGWSPGFSDIDTIIKTAWRWYNERGY